MLKKTTSGFSIVEVVMVLLIVSVIGVGGWFVWQSRQGEETQKAVAVTKDNKEEKPETTQPLDPSEGGKYLVIKEWGVRFEPPENLRGKVTYRVLTSPQYFNSPDSQSVYFEVSSVSELPGGSNCAFSDSNENGLGVYIKRATNRAHEPETKLHYFSNKQLGDRFFYSAGRIKYSDQCTGNENYTQQISDTIGSLVSSLDSLEVLP